MSLIFITTLSIIKWPSMTFGAKDGIFTIESNLKTSHNIERLETQSYFNCIMKMKTNNYCIEAWLNSPWILQGTQLKNKHTREQLFTTLQGRKWTSTFLDNRYGRFINTLSFKNKFREIPISIINICIQYMFQYQLRSISPWFASPSFIYKTEMCNNPSTKDAKEHHPLFQIRLKIFNNIP